MMFMTHSVLTSMLLIYSMSRFWEKDICICRISKGHHACLHQEQLVEVEGNAATQHLMQAAMGASVTPHVLQAVMGASGALLDSDASHDQR